MSEKNINIFSLNKFRKIKDNYYTSKEECEKYIKKYGEKYQTNPRFKLFDQLYFTAGDEKDIKKYALMPIMYFYSTEEKKKIMNGNEKKIFKLYKNIDYHSIKNTFDYMFYKFKKGIFVIIKDNKLVTYLPFSNNNYKNNWYKKTYFSEEEKKLLEENEYRSIKNILNKNIIDFQRKYPDQYKYYKIDFDRQSWVANNCIFRNQFPKYEGELNSNIFKNMIETLLTERNDIPDVEFFINDRDFPILKKDFTEPFNHIFDSDKVKIEEQFRFEKMAPIFSKSITSEFADILLPTNDDWLMASGLYFIHGCSDSYHKWNKINTDWNSKKEICIFRGSATGCGNTIDNNMRLKAADISFDYPQLLDAKIIDWNARVKKYKNKPIEIINPDNFRFTLGNKINNIEKSNYKYILYIDGNVSAFRLSSELSMNSVILIVKSDYKLWFSDKLEEYVHYVPVLEDLSDLISKIEWCKKNDKECKKIAGNAMAFFNKYLTKDGILDYMSSKLKLIYNNKYFKNLLDVKKLKKNIAIIICFRNNKEGTRERERKLYIQYMNTILKPYFNFHIYIIEQSDDNELFNIGKLKNIGFEIASKIGYNNYIFSDIDTIPDYDLIPYFHKKIDGVIGLAYRGTRYQSLDEKIGKPFLGALINFGEKTFKKINGYPNNFWGWGGEDDALINRLLNSGYDTIYYPEVGSIIDIEEDIYHKTINSTENKVKMTNKDLNKYEKLYEDLDLKSFGKNGLSDLNYKILLEKDINENVTQITVDLLKKEDMKKYPDLYKFNGNIDWKQMGKIVYSKINEMKVEFV